MQHFAASGSETRVTDLAVGAASSLIGVHFDSPNLSGSSFAVYGNNCLGGYINMSGWWANRVSSTQHGICTRVKHHDYANKGGSYQSTWWGGGALSYMTNRANSISYTMV